MMVRNDTCLVTDVVINVLQTVLSQKLVAGFERYLDYGAKFGELFRSVILDVGDAFEVRYKLLRDNLPCCEPK